MQPHKPPTVLDVVFAVLVATLFCALGGYLSTFPTEIVRAISLLVMVGSVVGLAIWFWWGYWRPSVGMFLVVMGTALIVIGSLVGFVGALMVDKEGSPSPIEGSIFLSCSLLGSIPSVIPESGHVSLFQISPIELSSNRERLVSRDMTGTPGEKINWPELIANLSPGRISQCDIINDTKDPLLDLRIAFPFVFSAQEEKSEIREARNLLIQRVDAGSDSKFTCFLINSSEQILSFIMPDMALARTLTDKKQRPVAVTHPSNPIPPLGNMILLMPTPSPPKHNS